MSRWSYHPPILAYHRVGPYKGDHAPTVSGEAFERQMACVARHRFRVVGLEDVVGCLDRGVPVPRRRVVITFDDGYEETHSVAWPILKRFGFPATLFITPGEVGEPGFATWEQVDEMARDGIRIGSHTMRHSYLPRVPEDRLEEELIHSKRVIEERIRQPVQFISYPIGGYTPRVQAIVKQGGYLAACTTNRAASTNGIDRFALRRIKVTERDQHPWLFRAKLTGYYDLFRQLKPPH